MEIPNKLNIRIVFKFSNEEVYTKFYWFKMDNDELYWGSPKKTKLHHYTVKPDDENVTIKIPENFDSFPLIESKISYHKSGEVHLKNLGEEGEVSYEAKNKWLLKNEIHKPVNIFTVLSSVIDLHTEKIENPNRKKNHSIRFEIPEDCLKKRFYMECYICPEGKHDFPPPLLKLQIPHENIVSISLSSSLILVIRFTFVCNFEDWQPDAEISFVPIDLK